VPKYYENKSVKRSRNLDHWLAFGTSFFTVLSVTDLSQINSYHDLVTSPGIFLTKIGAALAAGLAAVSALRKKLDPMLVVDDLPTQVQSTPKPDTSVDGANTPEQTV
jgi:hypothetical protein